MERNLAALASAFKSVCLKEFGNVPYSELYSLSETMMRELLEDDELVVESEVDVCETLMKWLNSQTRSGHSVQPYHFLNLIRWSAVPVEYVNTILNNSILKKDRQCFEFLSKVISYRLTGVQFNGLNTFHRTSTGIEQCVVIVGLDIRSTASWLPSVFCIVQNPRYCRRMCFVSVCRGKTTLQAHKQYQPLCILM